MKEKTKEEYVQIDQVDWQPFPEAFSTGGIRWKLLNVAPELGSWTATVSRHLTRSGMISWTA